MNPERALALAEELLKATKMTDDERRTIYGTHGLQIIAAELVAQLEDEVRATR